MKMAGFDLSAKRSGKSSKKAVPVISKKGNAALRYGVYQAAFTVLLPETLILLNTIQIRFEVESVSKELRPR